MRVEPPRPRVRPYVRAVTNDQKWTQGLRARGVRQDLDATRHPGRQEHETVLRARGAALHARLEELRRARRAAYTQRAPLQAATDRDGLLRLAQEREASADRSDLAAEVYDELVTTEPSLAEEHRVTADRLRARAASARSHAADARRRAEDAPE